MKHLRLTHGLVAICTLTLIGVFSVCMTSHKSFATSHELMGIRFASSTLGTYLDTRDSGMAYNELWRNSVELRFDDTNHPAPRDLSRTSIPGAFFSSNVNAFHPKWDGTKCTLADVYDFDKWHYRAYNSSNRNSLTLGFDYFASVVPDDYSVFTRCNRLDSPYNSSLPFDDSSLSYIWEGLHEFDPKAFYNAGGTQYRNYITDGFWTSHRTISSVDGSTTYTALNLNELFDVSLDYMTALCIRVYDSDTDEDCTGSIEDRPVEVKGQFNFSSSVDFNTTSTPLSGFDVVYLYITSEDTRHVYGQAIPCTTTYTHFEDLNDILEFSCSFNNYHPTNLDSTHINKMSFKINNTSNWFWHFTGDVYFGSMYVITDGFNTQGCTLHNDLHGDYIGGQSRDNGNGSDDWFTKFTNLFNFNFLNPFIPIFGLFTNQNSCASIPTLSSMLHFEEGQVCPWFDSSTRAIVTPVVGLFSMMLVVGFIIKWLNGGSGNFFEDSSGEVITHDDNFGWHRRKK